MVNRKHGMHRTATYQSWSDMKGRCDRASHRKYRHYGGRGIAVCQRWREFSAFLADMGEAPEGFTLERIDVNLGYEPGNCRWAAKDEQPRNQRRSVMVTVGGQRMCLREACRVLGVNYRTAQSRINILGQTVEQALRLSHESPAQA